MALAIPLASAHLVLLPGTPSIVVASIATGGGGWVVEAVPVLGSGVDVTREFCGPSAHGRSSSSMSSNSKLMLLSLSLFTILLLTIMGFDNLCQHVSTKGGSSSGHAYIPLPGDLVTCKALPGNFVARISLPGSFVMQRNCVDKVEALLHCFCSIRRALLL